MLLGADSCVSLSDTDETVTPDSKIVAVNGWLIGISGSWSAVMAAHGDGISGSDDVATLWRELRDMVNATGCAADSWDALVAYSGALWALDGLSAPMRIQSRTAGRGKNRVTRATWAVGSGSNYACGALRALDDAPLTLEQRAESALSIASEYASGVRPPWRFLSA